MVKTMRQKHYKKSPKYGKKRGKNHSKRNMSLNKIKRGQKTSRKIALHKKRGNIKGIKRQMMFGGMVSSPAAGPVGYSWDGGNESSRPGVELNTQGATMSNHFKVSPNGIVVGGIDPYSGSSGMSGGKRHRKKRYTNKKQMGGFFQEIVNLGRGVQSGINGGYFDLIGKQQPINQNPFPTENQPINNDYKFIGSPPPNVRGMFINANNKVSQI